MAEASPIARGKNLTLETLLTFIDAIPTTSMPKNKFLEYGEQHMKGWRQTHSQIARQLALYFEDDNEICHPRFNHKVSPVVIMEYAWNWAHRYYAPNPYTPSLEQYQGQETNLYAYIKSEVAKGNHSFTKICNSIFGIELNNLDKVRVYLSNFTDLIISDDYVGINSALNDDSNFEINPSVNFISSEAYFNHFTIDIPMGEKIETPLKHMSRQIIYYGAPGTGKSYRIKGLVRDGNHVRTTFHPDSDYASFVGAYKPTMIEISSRDMAGHVILDKGEEVMEKKIVYEFVAQAFLQAYTEAWKRSVGQMTDKEGKNVEMPEGMDDKYYLVIEEINRGNCAQIFGDLFQLLDRDDNGESSYAIRPDQDMKRYLAEQFKDIEALPETIRRGEEMKLPSNLYIFATMNTSDQSLFPIDSAFKRRWDWEYVPIKDEKKGYFIKVGDSAYLWSDFLEKINETILRVTQSDDKQMGYWFVHLPEGQKEISTDKFVGKVLFYLWNDVFKDFGDGEDTIFIGEKEDSTKYELRFKDFFGDDRNERIVDLMRYNKVEPTVIEDETEEETLSGEVAPANGGESEWQAQFDNYWKGFQDIWAKAPNIKNRFNRFHANAMLLNVDGSENVRMRFSLHPTNWHKVSINLRVADGSPEAEMLKTNLDKIRELTGEQDYQYVVDRKYGLVQLRSNELDFKNQEEISASYDWLLNQGEKLLSAFNTIHDKE